MSEKRDAHHLCHDRVTWDARPEGCRIREKIIAFNMARTVHNLVHCEQSAVPVPLFPTLQFVDHRFKQGKDVYDSIYGLTDLLYQANDRQHVKPVEVDINLLCIEALENQIPYLRDGLPCPTYIDLGANNGMLEPA